MNARFNPQAEDLRRLQIGPNVSDNAELKHEKGSIWPCLGI